MNLTPFFPEASPGAASADMLDCVAFVTVMVGQQAFQAIPADAVQRIVTAIANRFQTASHSISNGFALLEPSAGNASSG